jgi:hypothetical protein
MRRSKGQSTLEYAVVIAVVIAAMVFMGWGWFRGAYQKKIMSAGDEISGGGQFDVAHTSVTSSANTSSSSTETMTGSGAQASFNTIQNQTSSSSYNANTAGLDARKGGH